MTRRCGWQTLAAAAWPPSLVLGTGRMARAADDSASSGAPVGWLEIALGVAIVLLAATGKSKQKSRRRAAPAARGADARPLALLLMFLGSGCAALIYEIVWLQMLQLVLGSSAVSIGILLGTFMGGMCLGSLALARFIAPERHPLQVYALLEIGLGVCGIMMPAAIPLVRGVYTSVVGSGASGLLLRGFFAAICLLPPTLIMGATLPAVSRWVKTSPRGISRIGYLYGANTLGAVTGCLLAGFYLLRVYDVYTATFVAVALNLAIATGAYALGRAYPRAATADDGRDALDTGGAKTLFPPTSPRIIYLAIGLSGMTALGAEVIWTRLFGLLLSSTTYTFSIILAVFLIGIGLGSGIGSSMVGGRSDPRKMLGFAQLGLGVAIAWTTWNITSALPYWPVHPRLAVLPWYQFQIDFVRCLWAILPAACLWGASFPFALSAINRPGMDGGKVVGRLYAANTVGAIVGALGTSLFVIPAVGTQRGAQLLLALSAGAAAITLVPALWPDGAKSRFARRDAIATLAILELAAVLARHTAAVPALLVAHGRLSAVERNTKETFLYVGEGMSSSPAVSRDLEGTLSYYNAGKIQASSLPQDMRLQRMLGHLTTLVPEQPRDVLVIACGAGVTAGAASIDPRVERLTIAEIEPLVPRFVAPLFHDFNFDVVANPKVHIELDDARHFLTTTRQSFDAITSDPFDPWVKGAANLYTREFWDLAKRHLKPGGVVTVFVQLYDSGLSAVKSEVATFFEAFPNGIVWDNTIHGQGYDIVLMGRVDSTPIDVDALDRRLKSPEYAQVLRSLLQIGMDSALDLLTTYGGRASDLEPWLRNAEVNRDDNLRLQFLAGLGMNMDERAEIYRGMSGFRRYPNDVFTGSPATLGELRDAITRPR